MQEPMASDLTEIGNTLWNAADRLRANSGIRPADYARPVMGLLFLRHADERFAKVEKKISPRAGSRVLPVPRSTRRRARYSFRPRPVFRFS